MAERTNKRPPQDDESDEEQAATEATKRLKAAPQEERNNKEYYDELTERILGIGKKEQQEVQKEEAEEEEEAEEAEEEEEALLAGLTEAQMTNALLRQLLKQSKRSNKQLLSSNQQLLREVKRLGDSVNYGFGLSEQPTATQFDFEDDGGLLTLPETGTFAALSGVYEVAALRANSHKQPWLYVREATTNLWGELNKEQHPRVVVRGSPGSGKSLACFAWLRHQVQASGKPAVWIKVLDRSEFQFALVLPNNAIVYRFSQRLSMARFLKELGVELGADFSLMMLDGVTADDHDLATMVKAWANAEEGRRLIVITSNSAGKLECTDCGRNIPAVICPYLSWAPQEYMAVLGLNEEEAEPGGDDAQGAGVQHKQDAESGGDNTPGEDGAPGAGAQDKQRVVEIRQEITDFLLGDELLSQGDAAKPSASTTPNPAMLKVVVKRKVFYTGGFARGFFDWPIQKVIDWFQDGFAQVANFSDVAGLRIGHESSNSVNRLVAQVCTDDRPKVVLVSPYVAVELQDRVQKDKLHEFSKLELIRDNPCVSGYLFEFLFLLAVRASSVWVKVGSKDRWSEWTAPAVHKMLNKSYLRVEAGEIPSFKHSDDCWLVPNKYNQASFDAIFLSASKVCFVQITQSAKHGFGVEAAATFLAALSETTGKPATCATVVFVVPKDKGETFKGTLSKEKWPDNKHVSDTTIHVQTVEWDVERCQAAADSPTFDAFKTSSGKTKSTRV